MSLPAFTPDGVLPAADYTLTLSELKSSMLVLGPASCPQWDRAWRHSLVKNLEILVGQLSQVGIREIFIDGSFVEDKDRPSDIDGYFICDLYRYAKGDLQRELNKLDPHKVWTWDPRARRSAPGYQKAQLPMWHQYRVELYPHYGNGPIFGPDANGHPQLFPAAFRKRRSDSLAKGIVKIGGLP